MSLAGNGSVSVVREAGISVKAQNPGLGGLELGVRKTTETTTEKDGEALTEHETSSEKVVGYELKGIEESTSESEITVGVSTCALICLGGEIGLDTQKMKEFLTSAKAAILKDEAEPKGEACAGKTEASCAEDHPKATDKKAN